MAIKSHVIPPTSGGGSSSGPFVRTLLIKDATVADDVADHVPIFKAGHAVRVIGVLRKVITSDLTVRVNMDGVALATITIPFSTAVDTPVVVTTFTPDDTVGDLAVLSWDITASDNSADAAGVASITVQWR